jgi:hypothetical protein
MKTENKEIEEEEDPTIEDMDLYESENLYDSTDDIVDEDETIE